MEKMEDKELEKVVANAYLDGAVEAYYDSAAICGKLAETMPTTMRLSPDGQSKLELLTVLMAGFLDKARALEDQTSAAKSNPPSTLIH